MIDELIFSLGKSAYDNENDISAYWITGEGLHFQEVYRDRLMGEIVISEEGVKSLLEALHFLMPRIAETGEQPEPERVAIS